jgi:hypothetical protein
MKEACLLQILVVRIPLSSSLHLSMNNCAELQLTRDLAILLINLAS